MLSLLIRLVTNMINREVCLRNDAIFFRSNSKKILQWCFVNRALESDSRIIPVEPVFGIRRISDPGMESNSGSNRSAVGKEWLEKVAVGSANTLVGVDIQVPIAST